MIDIVISFDTTGSMYPCLAEVRRKVESFISTLFKQTDDLRIGIVAHGDYCDYSTYITKWHPLSDNQQSLIDFVRNVPATHGGDADECYERVLEEALSLNWRVGNKVFIMIGDCAPHEPGYTYGFSTVKKDWRFLITALKEQGIKAYGVQCLNRIEYSAMYTRIATSHETPKLDLHQFSNIVPLLTALVYKQQGNEQVEQYAQQLELEGGLNRNMVNLLNQLLGDKKIGAIEFDKVSEDLRAVDPARFQALSVDSPTDIMSFVRSTGAIFRKGRGFYELTKAELVQERKEVVLQDIKTGDMWSGHKAREMIGIPYGTRGKVYPKRDFPYRVFIQSTSSNRKLMANTKFLYEAK